MYNILCRGKKRTSPSLGSSSESASPAPVSSPPALATFGVKDGDDLGDRLTADGCWGLEKASHRHTIICVQTNQCTEYFEISKNINQMVCLMEEQTLHTTKWLAVTKVWSKSFGLVTEHRHYNPCPIYLSARYHTRRGKIVECGIVHFICAFACCAHIRRSGIILTPRLPLCQFFSVTPSIAELAHGENRILTQSLKSSTHPAYLICLEPKLLL